MGGGNSFISSVNPSCFCFSPPAPMMSWPHSWIIWRCRNVRTEFALLWLLPLWQRPVHLLPCCLPSWMSTACQSWMCRTVCSSRFLSFSSILEKWAKITFTQWHRCWRTLSWTGEWKGSYPRFVLLICVSTWDYLHYSYIKPIWKYYLQNNQACFPTETLNVVFLIYGLCFWKGRCGQRQRCIKTIIRS